MNSKDWIAVEQRLPKKGQRVIACDLIPGEKPQIHVVTYTGVMLKEWLCDFSGSHTTDLSYFTYWMPFEIQFPDVSKEQIIAQFQSELAIKSKGDSITVITSAFLPEQYVNNAVMKKGRNEDLNIGQDRSKLPLITYTFN